LEDLGPLPWYRLVYPIDGEALTGIAYNFDFRHADGRDPETYVGPLRAAIAEWQAGRSAAYRALRYLRGPGFLVVQDRRPGLTADYSFDEHEALLYLACADGATPAEAWATLQASRPTDVDVDDVRTFLDELVSSRLAYEEQGRYLALALPASLPEMP
jgi:hypothetical protein